MKVQIQTDGRTVWVNDETGMCIGRFGPRGIDIHQGIEKQLVGEHCMFCVPAKDPMQKFAHADDWRTFIEKMKDLHGVDVPAHLNVQLRYD